jgi:serine/threonine protein kinase/TolB-like protein/Tfp pilus assembly protein PilF
MAINSGTLLGHYEILDRIGAGGMGELYLARDKRLDRRVAVKFLPDETTADQDARKRLIGEARASARLDHPNICSIYEVGEEEGRIFIVMQYIEGETFASFLQHGQIELREVLEIAVQIADALAEAHSHGIIHRDVKPQNIMISARRQVKVLDFGLAKTVKARNAFESEVETQSLLTEAGALVGTVPYMSPEQVRGQSLDVRSDIFSFGTVLYEAITGRHPFAAENAAATLSAILTGEPPMLARYSRKIPQELERIVTKALRKDREQRYQTVKDLLIDLKSLRQRLEFEAELERSAPTDPGAVANPMTRVSQTSVETAKEPTVQTKDVTPAPTSARMHHLTIQMRRHKPALAGLLLLLVAFIGLGFYLLARPVKPTDKAIGSIAILPLVNASADSNAEYLSDGITESVINSLSQLPGLKVIARTTVFRYKGQETDPQNVGRNLGVDAVVTGKVILQSNMLVVQVDMMNVADGSQLWGEKFNRKLSDILTVQEEIARQISNKLRIKLTGEENKRVIKRYTDNAEAYQLYLQGRFHWNKLAEEETKRAIEYFNRAIETDPLYALPYAGLADCYSNLTLFGSSAPKDTFPRAKAAAMKAIEMDDSLAAAHTAMGRVRQFFDWDLGAAEKEFKRAIELNPNDAIAREAYGNFLRSMARLEEALTETKLAQEFDPLSPYMSGSMGWVWFYMRRFDEAIAQFRRTLEMDPTYGNPHWGIARALVQKGMYNDAITEMDKGGLDFATPLGTRGHAYALMGNNTETQRLLDEGRNNPLHTLDVAFIYIGLGQKDQAFEWLNKAYEARSPWLVFGLKIDPRYDSLRSDPRFGNLLRRMNLAP